MKDQTSVELQVEVYAGDSSNKLQQQDDRIATEKPVALVFNGISHAVLMATPENLTEFATGFSFTEGIITHKNEILDCEILENESGIEVQLTLSSQQFNNLKERRRNLVGRTGCGICGAESLAQIRLPLEPVESDLVVSHEAVRQATQKLASKQPIQGVTGAVHGAAWCSDTGEILMLYEDVGRHNALDKLIGGMLIQDRLHQPGFLLISSRASYEMVQKAAMAKIAIVVAVSAATSLAVDIARENGICLLGFSRDLRHVVYSHGQRLA